MRAAGSRRRRLILSVLGMGTAFSYAVIGTGGVGGYYGALLQRSGQEVHYLLHSDYGHVQRHGLSVTSVGGDFILPRVNAYGDHRAMPRCDVAIVALKATANGILPDILPGLLNERGIVLLLQNGFGQEDFIAAIPGVRTIVAGLCFVCTAKTGPGAICHQDYGSMILAEFTRNGDPAGVTELMRHLGRDLSAAGVPVEMSPDLVAARWRKLVWNIPFNGLCTLFQADTASILNSSPLRRLVQEIMQEVAEGAAALRRVIPPEFLDKMIADTRAMRPYFPSMKLDLDAGKELELEAMYHKPLEVAQLHGKRLVRIEMLYEELSFLSGKKTGRG